MNSDISTPPRRCNDSNDNSNSVATNNTNYSDSENKINSNEIKFSVGDGNDISLNDFLDFLNVSYHVNNMIKNSVQQMGSKSEKSGSKTVKIVDFEDLAKNRLIKELDRQCCDMKSSERMGCKSRTTSVSTSINDKPSNRNAASNLNPKLNKKLDYVINEGVMDPILPFICPVPVPKALSKQTGIRHKCRESGGDVQGVSEATTETIDRVTKPRNSAKRGGSTRRKSVSTVRSACGKAGEPRSESDLIIHVCDEVKNTKRDFSCPQNLLVGKMGYFADIDGCQKLEEMDISVHCDIHIFEWLMRWVKYSTRVERGAPASLVITSEPTLDASNVVPILISASFLQMEALIVQCLAFCHAHLNDVVRSSTNLTTINDAILTRLAAMFTNVELELVRDRKERVTPRLWAKLIQSLCESEPEALRGHYFSLAGLFRCSKCGKCLTRSAESHVSCVASNVRINRWGQLVSYHVRDNNWDMSTFITQLFKEMQSWRLVYWKLWGHCHYLYCSACEQHFPAYQMKWCPHHPEAAVFLGPSAEGRNSSPVGRYPCCAKQAFRFNTLNTLNGCKFREHVIQSKTDRERSIQSIAQLVSDGSAMCLPPKPKRKPVACKDEVRWCGILMTSRRPRRGLLPRVNAEVFSGKLLQHFRINVGETFTVRQTNKKPQAKIDSVESQQLRKMVDGSDEASDETSSESDSESARRRADQITKFYIAKGPYTMRENENFGRYWSREVSARNNQDRQRDFEEKMLKKVLAIVSKKTASEHNLIGQKISARAGSYIRLESEWKEQMKKRDQILVNQITEMSSSSNSKNHSSINNSGSNTNIGNFKQRYKQ